MADSTVEKYNHNGRSQWNIHLVGTSVAENVKCSLVGKTTELKSLDPEYDIIGRVELFQKKWCQLVTKIMRFKIIIFYLELPE